MSSECVVQVLKIAKCFHIYKQPSHRLWQILCGKHKQFYKEFWAVKELCFSIFRGEAVGIVGLNGSGKSTLLQLICKTLHPTSGRIETQGRIAALLELGSGFNAELTGRENVFLYAALFGLSQKEIQARYDKITQFAEIGDFIDEPVKTYSSGMHVRLAFAVIANIDADVLVIDEALSVGDAFFQQKCMRFLHEFREKGTLIFVSHDMGAVINLCSRALWIDKGALRLDASPKEVADAYLAHYYELQQGDSDPHFKKATAAESSESEWLDAITSFPAFGSGEAVIQNVVLLDELNRKLSKVYGGEAVTLCVVIKMKNDIHQPIVGFQIKDRLGQIIFGNNTYLQYENSTMHYKPEDVMIARFSFIMPMLIAGSYTFQVAIANGTQMNHVQLHWIYDALMIEFLPSDRTQIYFDGLIHIPIMKMELKHHSLTENFCEIR